MNKRNAMSGAKLFLDLIQHFYSQLQQQQE